MPSTPGNGGLRAQTCVLRGPRDHFMSAGGQSKYFPDWAFGQKTSVTRSFCRSPRSSPRPLSQPAKSEKFMQSLKSDRHAGR